MRVSMPILLMLALWLLLAAIAALAWAAAAWHWMDCVGREWIWTGW